MFAHKVGGLAALAGLSIMLVGGGLAASWSDSAQVQGGANVGTFACELSSTTPGAVVSGDTISYTEPAIQSSAILDFATLSVDVEATGSIPVLVHWTYSTDIVAGGHWAVSMGTPSIVDDVTLQPAESKHYDDLGFVVTELDNTDLDTTHTVSYTANCAEVPPPPSNVLVPDVLGFPEADAVSSIQGAGLTLGAMAVAYSDSVPAGRIVSTSPVAGASVPPGTPVDCVKSKGPERVLVPDVLGKTNANAVDDITAAGLTPNRLADAYSNSVPDGRVISTDPVAGASVAPGTTVDYVVSKGAEPPPPDPVQYIGTATAASTAAVTYPAGTQAGDIVVAVSSRSAATSSSLIGGPATGFTKFGNTQYTGGKSCGTSGGNNCYQTSAVFYHVVTAGETASGTWPNARIVRIVVYRHASVGANSGTSGSSYPALTLQVSDGSSWVAGLAASTGVTAGVTYSISSNGGVTSWAGAPVSPSHAFSIELKRN